MDGTGLYKDGGGIAGHHDRVACVGTHLREPEDGHEGHNPLKKLVRWSTQNACT